MLKSDWMKSCGVSKQRKGKIMGRFLDSTHFRFMRWEETGKSYWDKVTFEISESKESTNFEKDQMYHMVLTGHRRTDHCSPQLAMWPGNNSRKIPKMGGPELADWKSPLSASTVHKCRTITRHITVKFPNRGQGGKKRGWQGRWPDWNAGESKNSVSHKRSGIRTTSVFSKQHWI